MSDQEKSGKNNNLNISGGVGKGAQIAVGEGNTQVNYQAASSPVVAPADLSALKQLLADLRMQVETQAPSEKKDDALKQVNDLEEALDPKQPDIDRMGGVKSWFKRNIPKLAGAVAGVIIHPIVGKIVEATGEGLSAEIQRRFGTEK